MIHQILPTTPARVLRGLLHAPAARPLRFVGIGVAAGAFQLVLLTVLIGHGWDDRLANVVAFLVAAQVNFVLSSLVTWRDRWIGDSLLHRWGLFHASIAVMAALNMLVFVAARDLAPSLMASAFGIAAGACGNYLAGDRLVFRGESRTPVPSTSRSSIA